MISNMIHTCSLVIVDICAPMGPTPYPNQSSVDLLTQRSICVVESITHTSIPGLPLSVINDTADYLMLCLHDFLTLFQVKVCWICSHLV